MFCKHDDEIIDKTIMNSAFEQLEATNQADRMKSVGNVELLFRKKVIIILKCTKCKRVREIVETNP